ncbi:hypothetical protein RhiirC2_786329 [Rhizophagus irregularis]|uniref:MULE transposase domain-containing protein n=1 Tax=Rhizophagus irregularis TaxID=588596 RepID=A0A2N1MUM9_9GLOM|nr:hypothetical protein RhiirC2_786329 [Rhizophagus irregularis]
MQHVLHPNRADISIPPEIKDFISDNISLLPREIYIQLVERGLNGKNRSTFAWTELNNTKNLNYMPLAEVDGVCFPLAYLFLGKVDCGDGIRTVSFCPQELRPLVWEFMSKHFQYPLIQIVDGQFLSSNSIWTMAVEEAYNVNNIFYLGSGHIYGIDGALEGIEA